MNSSSNNTKPTNTNNISFNPNNHGQEQHQEQASSYDKMSASTQPSQPRSRSLHTNTYTNPPIHVLPSTYNTQTSQSRQRKNILTRSSNKQTNNNINNNNHAGYHSSNPTTAHMMYNNHNLQYNRYSKRQSSRVMNTNNDTTNPPVNVVYMIFVLFASLLFLFILFRMSMALDSTIQHTHSTIGSSSRYDQLSSDYNENYNPNHDISPITQQILMAALRNAQDRSFQGRTWPYSITEEQMEYEFISITQQHVGEDKIAVPSFYFLPQDLEMAFVESSHLLSTSSSSSLDIEHMTQTLLGNDGKLLTPQVTQLIGTISASDARAATPKFTATNDWNDRTIYVSIILPATTKDLESIIEALDSLFGKARYPNRIRVGIVDEVYPNMKSFTTHLQDKCETTQSTIPCSYQTHIDSFQLTTDPSSSSTSSTTSTTMMTKGTMFLRHLSNRMYRNEHYYLQVDSNVEFVQDWDLEIILQFESAENEMAVLSTYLSNVLDRVEEENDAYGSLIEEVEVGQDKVEGSESILRMKRTAQFLICQASYDGVGKQRMLRYRKKKQPRRLPPVDDKPLLHPFWSSGFSFSRGHFVLLVPYDPYVFLDVSEANDPGGDSSNSGRNIGREQEELSMSLRGFSHGYDFYVPYKSVAYSTMPYSYDEDFGPAVDELVNEELHDYFDGSQASNVRQSALARLHTITGLRAHDANIIWDEREIEKYGLGKAREISKFFDTFGIHVKLKVIESKLCDFITSGAMHKKFTSFLRRNRMGIDYTQFDYRFHELTRIHLDDE